MNSPIEFSPDWSSPPGNTIRDMAEIRGLSEEELCLRLEIPKCVYVRLLSGAQPLTSGIAKGLQANLGGTVGFWVQRENQYRKGLEARADFAASESLSEILPLREMGQFGWLTRFRRDDGELSAALRFFGVRNRDDFYERYEGLATQLAFRKSSSFETKLGPLAAWYRAAELESAHIPCRQWNQQKFKKALLEVRSLTRDSSTSSFFPELQAKCALAGVAVVMVKAPRGCPVSGISRFLDGKGVIFLSGRHLTDDHFWFSFFHEAAHLLLHGKEEVFIEADALEGSSKEDEANEFSASFLVPPERVQELHSLPANKYSIVRFARSIGISPGLVVGQMQHRGIIRRNQMNFLKRKLSW